MSEHDKNLRTPRASTSTSLRGIAIERWACKRSLRCRLARLGAPAILLALMIAALIYEAHQL